MFSTIVAVSLSLVLGVPYAKATVYTYERAPRTLVPDRTVVYDTVTVPETYVVCDVNLMVDIQHTWSSDLVLELESPGGAVIQTIFQRGCGRSDNIVEIFDDQASLPPFSATSFDGECDDGGESVQPNEPLSAFNGLSSSGTWTLKVADVQGGDSGMILSWKLIMTSCGDSGMGGDPHIMSWIGEWFGYMGECDLKLIHAPKFDGHSDLDIHARTTIRDSYSYIETAVVRIGNDTLEVSSFGEYSLNGVDNANVKPSAANFLCKSHLLPKLGGYPVYHTSLSKKKHSFDIVLGNGQNITVSNMKDIVSVAIKNGTKALFGGVEGLLGNFQGKMLARDGVTDLHDDVDALGQEWQIRDDEPMLFQTVRAPQYPELCHLPDVAAKEARRLGEGISEEEAKAACVHLKGNINAFEACVYDVTATNDLDQAQSGAF